MKRQVFIFFLILSICINYNSYCQDIIYTKDFSDTIQCKIIKDNIISLEFRYWNSTDTSIHILKGTEIEYYLLSDKKFVNEIINANISDSSKSPFSDNRVNKPYSYLGPKSLEDILKANIKGHIELKRKIQFRPIVERGGFIVLVKYNFDVDGIGNSRVGLGGGKLKPFMVNDEIVLKNMYKYSDTRILGLLTMYPMPFSIMVLGIVNDAKPEIVAPIVGASYLIGKILYHFVAIKFLRKAINRHNIVVSEMRKTQ